MFCGLSYYLKANFMYKLIKPTFIECSALCTGTGESKISPMHAFSGKTDKKGNALVQKMYLKNFNIPFTRKTI